MHLFRAVDEPNELGRHQLIVVELLTCILLLLSLTQVLLFCIDCLEELGGNVTLVLPKREEVSGETIEDHIK